MKILALLLALCCGAFACAENAPVPEVKDTLQFEYVLSEGDDLFVSDFIFEDTVVISGDHGQIMFANCKFNGDIVNAAESGTRVIIGEDCDLNGKCIFRSGVQEATIESSFPKFVFQGTAEVVCEDSYGSAVSFGNQPLVYNGITYTAADSQLFFDRSNPDAGIVPYTGQESSCFVVVQWWENGEEKLLVECEYDPTMES